MSGCPTFDIAGPAGIAEALRAVDCTSGEAVSFAFARLFGSHAVLGHALTAALTLYIAFYAIGLLTGRASLSVASLTPRMMTLGIALTFATSWIAYESVIWNALSGAPDEIASLLVGTQGSATALFADHLDKVFVIVGQAAAAAEAAAPRDESSSLASGPNLLWLSALMLLLGTVGVLIAARIALAAMLALGPIFIICALFKGSRGLFEGWLKAAVLFSLTPLLAVLIGGGTIAMLSPMLDSLAVIGGEIPLRVAATVFVASAVYCALMFMTLKLASTMVAGWRLPLDRSREHQANTVAAMPISQFCLPIGFEHTSRRVGGRDQRVNAIMVAANGGSTGVVERVIASAYFQKDAQNPARNNAASQACALSTGPRLGKLRHDFRSRPAFPRRANS